MNATPGPSNPGPIFIVGAARSGTTIVSCAVQRMTGMALLGEGHIWPLLYHINRLVERYFAGIAHVIPDTEKCRLLSRTPAEIVDGITALFIDRFDLGGADFIDKTPGPEMIDSIDAVHCMFPNAFFVFIRRDPVGTVQSKLRKWPDINIADHCRDWIACLKAWERAKTRIGLRYCEIDHAALVDDPAAIGCLLASELGLDTSAASRFRDEVRFNTQVERTSADLQRTPSLRGVDWTEEEKLTFVRICHSTAEDYQYDIYGDPDLEDASGHIALFYPKHPSPSVYVEGKNRFSYPIEHGFQLCPNPYGQQEITLHVKKLALGQRRSLSLIARREYFAGPTVLLRILVLEAGGERIWNEFEYVVDNVHPTALAFDIDRGVAVVDVRVSVRLVNSVENLFSTVRISSPIIAARSRDLTEFSMIT